MALKKIDVSGIDSAIAETRGDELRQQEIEAQSDLSLQIRLFMKEAPYFINEIREAASPMDARKFTSIVSGNLQKSATEMAKAFNENITPTVKRIERAKNGIIVPVLAAYIIIVSLVWLFGFMVMVIFVNSGTIHSEQLSNATSAFIGTWIIIVAVIVYLTKIFKWY